jgi:hypothetical protein
MRSLGLMEARTVTVTFIGRLFLQSGDNEVAVENAPRWNFVYYVLNSRL